MLRPPSGGARSGVGRGSWDSCRSIRLALGIGLAVEHHTRLGSQLDLQALDLLSETLVNMICLLDVFPQRFDFKRPFPSLLYLNLLLLHFVVDLLDCQFR